MSYDGTLQGRFVLHLFEYFKLGKILSYNFADGVFLREKPKEFASDPNLRPACSKQSIELLVRDGPSRLEKISSQCLDCFNNSIGVDHCQGIAGGTYIP